MNSTNNLTLIEEARAARDNAIAPYSGFKVGAALRTRSGKVYRGCNVENSSFSLTVCAERVALLTALAAGEREFGSIAVFSQSTTPATPCGPCRQLLWEYCGDIAVTLSNVTGETQEYRMSDLLPYAFDFRPGI